MKVDQCIYFYIHKKSLTCLTNFSGKSFKKSQQKFVNAANLKPNLNTLKGIFYVNGLNNRPFKYFDCILMNTIKIYISYVIGLKFYCLGALFTFLSLISFVQLCFKFCICMFS